MDTVPQPQRSADCHRHPAAAHAAKRAEPEHNAYTPTLLSSRGAAGSGAQRAPALRPPPDDTRAEEAAGRRRRPQAGAREQADRYLRGAISTRAAMAAAGAVDLRHRQR